MNGVDDMLYMQSTNANDGTMTLTVTFDVDTEPNIDQVNVQNRMAQAQPNLPPEVNQFGLTMRKQTGLPMLIVSLLLAEADLRRAVPRQLREHQHPRRALPRARRRRGAHLRRRRLRDADLGEAGSARAARPDRAGSRAAPSSSRAPSIPSGQVGANPAPAGQEMTYTVRSQGRLQTEEEFGDIAVRSNPDGSVIRLRDVARDRARRAELPADRPRQRPAGLRDRRLPGARLERAGGRRGRPQRRWTLLRSALPGGPRVRVHARHDARRSRKASARS